MRQSMVARFLAVATMATFVGGTVAVDAPAAFARVGQPTDREFRIAGEPDRELAGGRTSRRIVVGSLPGATGHRSTYEPALRRPDGTFSPATPGPQGAGAPLPIEATSNFDIPVLQTSGVLGLSYLSGPATEVEPPDPFMAVGPEHVFQAVNTSFRISDRSGNPLETVDMFDFFGLGQFYHPDLDQVAYFNPRVIYDSLHSRWIAIQVSFDCIGTAPSTIGTGFIDLAISDGPDPTAGWEILSHAYTDAVPDYPGLGTSTDKVVFSANVFTLEEDGSAFGCDLQTLAGAEMDAMAWSQLLGTGDVNLAVFGSPGNQHFSWRPALQTPATSSSVFAIAERFDEGVAYARITGNPAVGGSTTITIRDLTGDDNVISPFASPPQPRQPGTPGTIANAVDARPTDAVWKDHKLAFVSTYPCDPAGTEVLIRDCVRVSQLSTATPTSPLLIQDFLIAQDSFDLYMGGIGYALSSDLHVVWTQSSELGTAWASSHSAYQDATAAVNTISKRALLAAGLGNYPGTRWGDYVGVAQDPQVPYAVWHGTEYAAGGTAFWATKASQYQTAANTYTPIEPARVLDTRPAYEIGLAGVFAANVPRTFHVGGLLGIPADATAITANVTVVNQTAAGFVSVTPTAEANPSSSTINFPLGDTRANNLTITVAPNGKLAAVYRAPPGKTTHLIVDVTGFYRDKPVDDDGSPMSGAFYTITDPVRVLDSRPAQGIGLRGPFAANKPRKVTIAGIHDIVAGTPAITGNLTVIGPTRAGYLAITKLSDPNPSTSNLNFPAGDTRANGVTVPLNASGALWIVYKASGGSANVILDMTGNYGGSSSPRLFHPLTPGRILDTRPGAVQSGLPGVFRANTPRRLDVAGHWGVPLDAGAITGNLTVVNQTAAGYVSATLTSNASPDTSVLNFPLGDTRANGVTLQLNDSGGLWFVYKAPAGTSTHLIFDVTGYFE